MSTASVLLAILGLFVLMIVHESGHYLAARRFGMRVTKFSIGFGPTLVKHRPKGSPTVFQVAIIPFLAYVQISGMNPYEESDPNDKESYANASLWARIVTIAAGPLANYLFASVFFFAAFQMAKVRVEVDDESMKVMVTPTGPAAASGMQNGDRVVSVNGQDTADWPALVAQVSSRPGETLSIVVERGSERLTLRPVPVADGETKGKIMIGPYAEVHKLDTFGAVVGASLGEPPRVVARFGRDLAKVIRGKQRLHMSGPVGIVKDVASAASEGAKDLLYVLGILSAYLGAFNLLPFPALDGGRLLFLAFEAISRRRADAKIEAKIHAVGLLMFLTLVAVLTYTEVMPKH